MADVTIKILTPATDFDLVTLAELKVALGITDASQDAMLEDQIDRYSDVVAELCNRVFAREQVRETWRCFGSDCPGTRLFLSHWPVAEDDIEQVEAPIGTVWANGYELEERSGKLTLFGNTATEVRVTYTGGFNLPEEAPEALKQACGLLISKSRTEQQQAAVSGIRQISHKQARVVFHDPNRAISSSSRTQTSGIDPALNSLLMHYTRLQV
jgi:hypothetical protein